jgi:hypothetical protein
VADPQLKGGFGPHELILSESGLREITPATDSFVKWSGITAVVRDGEHIFVRLVNGQAAVICRQSYSGPVTFDEIPKVIDDFRTKYTAEKSGSANPS